jgi:WD40 repeat protein/serine/threonine protein kinase
VRSAIEQHAEAGSSASEDPQPRPDASPTQPGEAGSTTKLTVLVEQALGTVIGRYKLLEKVGEGGFGRVYVAEQREPVKRRVALKIIKLGMDTRQVIARFEAERQALALMDHPNIAKVFDAGATDTGRPYFVMELVRGIKITDYCDQNDLSTSQRLDLFISVCQAIQHAHQKGIIHRDIKPSNILVTLHDGVPVPKVIDFGIAKATQGELTDKTVYTQLQEFIGTPAYMSPEQAEMSGLDMDTRADIYSLGVLLYELLTGRTPFDAEDLLKAGLEQMRRTIREKEPPLPSTRLTQELTSRSKIKNPKSEADEASLRRLAQLRKLIDLLRGDLDWIVMKCLEKDRTRRYETANGLALDVQRYLNTEPVAARPPSQLYRFQKLIRRNKLAFAAAGAVASALVLGLFLSTWEAVRASRAEESQRRLFREAEAGRAQESRLREQAEAARKEAVDAQLQAQKNLYAADMVLAFQALQNGNLGRLRGLLAKYNPVTTTNEPSGLTPMDLRGWEWRYLWGASRGDDMFALYGHSNEVPVAFLPGDGRTAFSASYDRTLKFWDLEKRLLLESIAYPDDPRTAAHSPDGRWIVVGGDYGYWSLWDALRRHLVLANTNSSGVKGTAFSPDSRQFAIADAKAVEVWDVADHRKIKSIPRHGDAGSHRGFVYGLAFSPDGRTLAYGWDDRVLIYDFASGSEVEVGKSDGGDALSLAFSPDGRTLVSANYMRITVWDTSARLLPKYLTNHLEQIPCVAFSPDGSHLASASGDQTVRLWETRSWQEIATLRGHEHEVHSVAFSPDGKYIVSSGKDQTVRVWSAQHDSRTRQQLGWPEDSPSPFLDLVPKFAPKKPTRDRQMHFQNGGASFRFLDLIKLEESASQSLPPAFGATNAIAVDPGAGLMAVGLKDGPVELWQTEPLEKLRTVAMSQLQATELALSQSGRWLAVTRRDQTTELWDIQDNRLIEKQPPLAEPVKSYWFYDGLSFWAEDRRLVRATGRSPQSEALIEVFLVPERERRLIRHTHKGPLNNFTLSHDGTLLATAAWDGLVKLWDVRSGRELATLRGQLVGFMGLAFSPDDSRLAAGANDGTITLWDMDTRQQVANWKAHPRSCQWLCFIDGGRLLASLGQSREGSTGTETRIWRAPSWEEIEAAKKAEAKTP